MRTLLLALIASLLLFSIGNPQGEVEPPPGREAAAGRAPAAEGTQETRPEPQEPVAPESAPAPSWRDFFPPRVKPMLQRHAGDLGLVFMILLGLLFCFFGQPWLKVLLAITGLLVGAATGYTVAANIGLSGQIQVGATIGGGLAGAALALFLFWLSLFALGAGFGGVLCLLVLMALGKVPATTAIFQEPGFLLDKLPWAYQFVLALSGLAGGLLTLWLQRFITVLATSFCGALLLVVNLLSLTEWGRTELERLQAMAPGGSLEFRWDALLLLSGWLFLGLLGALFQFYLLARRPPEKVPAPASRQEGPGSAREASGGPTGA